MKQLISTFVVLGLVSVGVGAVWAGPVNVNTADAETLARELNGIGPALAEEIVRDRDRNGRFESPDDLARVSGVGARIVERNREFILIDSGAPRQ